jgi:nucleotide-binding universal stress UspA family protein
MKLLNKILLATDFSKSSENVTKMAIKLAKKFDAKIVLLHVLPNEADIDSIRELLNLAVKTKFDQIKENIKTAGLPNPEFLLKFGSVFDEIIRIADYKNADVILMGSGKNIGDSSNKLSTTTGKVIQRTSKPVWVVKAGDQLNIKKILCPVDFSEPSKRALDNAIHLARRFDAQVNVMSVFEPIDVHTEELDFICYQNDELLKEYFDNFNDFLEGFNLKNINVKKTNKSGVPYANILITINKYKPDLLVMGTTGKTGLSKILIGSVTEKVTRENTCSFITTKSKSLIELNVEFKIQDIKHHCNAGKQLLEDGYLDEAIEQFHICLKINNMHIPTLMGLEKTYEIMGDESKSKMFRTLASEVLNHLYDSNVEKQIRKHYTV